MSSVLRGNFAPAKDVRIDNSSTGGDDLEARFEREAIKRLGGSIAYVSKKKIVWDAE